MNARMPPGGTVKANTPLFPNEVSDDANYLSFYKWTVNEPPLFAS